VGGVVCGGMLVAGGEGEGEGVEYLLTEGTGTVVVEVGGLKLGDEWMLSE
jgi:hypothetical protein